MNKWQLVRSENKSNFCCLILFSISPRQQYRSSYNRREYPLMLVVTKRTDSPKWLYSILATITLLTFHFLAAYSKRTKRRCGSPVFSKSSLAWATSFLTGTINRLFLGIPVINPTPLRSHQRSILSRQNPPSPRKTILISGQACRRRLNNKAKDTPGMFCTINIALAQITHQEIIATKYV